MSVSNASSTDLLWLQSQSGAALTSDARGLTAHGPGGVAGVMAFDLWTPKSAVAHVAVTSTMALRRLLAVAWRVVFEEWGLLVLRGTVLSNNRRCVAFARRIGFRETGVTVDGWKEGVDLVHFELRSGDWKANHVK